MFTYRFAFLLWLRLSYFLKFLFLPVIRAGCNFCKRYRLVELLPVKVVRRYISAISVTSAFLKFPPSPGSACRMHITWYTLCSLRSIVCSAGKNIWMQSECNIYTVFTISMCIYSVYTFPCKYIGIYSICTFYLYCLPAAADKYMHFIDIAWMYI